ncbi:MAG: FkbM family methyltransferase [Candidatus Galacturonibacter soehngenii]|nr:FkbM family methyltransferase [Candidatus Galacturonibacter soehngenii]
MKYLKRTALKEISSNYDFIVGWGTGTLLKRNYNQNYFSMDFIVDGRGDNLNTKYEGIEICKPERLKELKGRILIVIYTIYEKEIKETIKELNVNADTIIYNLLEIEVGNRLLPIWNGKNADDIILLELITRLGLDKVNYLDIGVCHPIMRNNTFLFYELGYKGVLVEPNPEFHFLIEKYRSKDTLLKIGVSSEKGELYYYNFSKVPGLNTFVEEVAEHRRNLGFEYTKERVALESINTVIEENFDTYPQIIDIDVEGLDYQILSTFDATKYPVDIIMCECTNQDEALIELMLQKGYKVYAHTIENYIFVRINSL